MVKFVGTLHGIAIQFFNMKYKIIDIKLGAFNCLLKIKGTKCEFDISFNTMEGKGNLAIQYTILETSGDRDEIDKIVRQMIIDNPLLTDI